MSWNPHPAGSVAAWWFDWCHLWLSIGLMRAYDCDDDEIDPSLTGEY